MHAQVLAQAVQLSSGALFIPITASLLAPLHCTDSWLNATWKCWSIGHAAVAVLCAVVCAAFCAALAICTRQHFVICIVGVDVTPGYPAGVACACCRDPNDDGADAKPHGRVDVMFLLIRAVLVLLFNFRAVLALRVLLASVCIAVAVMLWLNLKFAPWYNTHVLLWHTAAWFVVGWAAFCAILLVVRGSPKVRQAASIAEYNLCAVFPVLACFEPNCPAAPTWWHLSGLQTNVESFLFLLGAPSMLYAGYAIAWFVHHREVDVKARYSAFQVCYHVSMHARLWATYRFVIQGRSCSRWQGTELREHSVMLLDLEFPCILSVCFAG